MTDKGIFKNTLMFITLVCIAVLIKEKSSFFAQRTWSTLRIGMSDFTLSKYIEIHP